MTLQCVTTESTGLNTDPPNALRTFACVFQSARFAAVRPVVAALTLLMAVAAGARAQTVETDPLQCWWRSSTGAVRVGEPFTVVLTCAVLETDSTKVEVDQSKLEPSVVQFAPFEVMGGTHGVDQHTDLRRFFQYEYRLRLIAENEFGKDVPLPEMKLSYHVRSDMGQKAAIQGRDQSYVLPAQSIRILSLVPGDAADIRDASADTFADVDSRGARARLLITIGIVLFAVAGLMALLALVRLFTRLRKPSTAETRLVSDGTILRGASRELAAIQREREGTGWTPELAGRALTPLRVAAAYALDRPVAQLPFTGSPASNNGRSHEGSMIVRTAWPKRKQVSVSGAVTARSISHEQARGLGSARRHALLDSLDRALAQFTAAQYGQNGANGAGRLDDATLDEALSAGRNAVRRVTVEQTWLMRKFGPRRPPREVEARAWSR
jgi:hypothetical protein